MTSLVPCTACRRHFRREEGQCPFCGAERPASAGPLRAVVMPRDAARATLFALGLTLAGQACGGKTDGANDPSPSGAGASTGTGTGGAGQGTGGTGGTSNSGGCADNPLARSCSPTPPYGGIPRPYLPETGGSAGSSGMPNERPPADAGADDAGNSDAGPDDAGG